MQTVFLTLHTIPQVGFAHHFHAEHYDFSYATSDRSFEIVYVKSGSITAQIMDETYLIQPGSVFLLFRQLPIRLQSDMAQAHCSVQLVGEFHFSGMGGEVQEPDTNGLILPLILPPCAEAELIGKELYRIISELGVSREKNGHAASLAAMGLLAYLDRLCRKKAAAEQSNVSVLNRKIKKYIAEHIGQDIGLSEIAGAMEKTPNYLNSVFKSETGLPICRYIAREKVYFMAELMKNRGVSFKVACENASIQDISYGYRLFRRHMGMTPGEYMNAKSIRMG